MTVSSLWILHKVEVPIHRPARLAARHVDVFIPTYNEPLTVLEMTVHAAKRVRGVGRVLVLDDGNRAEVAQMARRLRAAYFAPEHYPHAKAGNMNNGLAQSTTDFILCLDADHVPKAKILERTMRYIDDSRVGFIQSPQAFTTPAVLSSAAHLRDDGLNRERSTTSSSWKSVFVPEALAVGLEAESLKEFFRQRRRWAAGSLGLLIPLTRLSTANAWLELAAAPKLHRRHVGSHLGLQKVASFLLPVASVMAVASPVTINWAVASSVLLLLYRADLCL